MNFKKCLLMHKSVFVMMIIINIPPYSEVTGSLKWSEKNLQTYNALQEYSSPNAKILIWDDDRVNNSTNIRTKLMQTLIEV